MAVYFGMYILLILIGGFSFSDKKIINRNKKIFLMFIIISLIIGLRDTTMGNDLPGYLGSFDLCRNHSLQEMITIRGDNYEIGYICFIKLISLLTDNKTIFLLINAIVSILPIMYVLKKKHINHFLSIIVFLSLPSFMMLFSALRQSIAFAICFFSILFIEGKDIKKFILTIIFASLFHKSAVIFLLAYPAYWIRIPQKTRKFTLFIIMLCFLLRKQLFWIITPLLDETYTSINETNSYGIFLLLICFYIFTDFMCNCNKEDLNGYLNILFLGIIIQSFASINSMAMRVSEYFILIMVLLIPSVLKNLKLPSNRKMLLICFYCFFIFLGLFYLYQGGDTWAKSYPYTWSIFK